MKSLILALSLMSSSAFAGFVVPELPNPVNDYAGVLSAGGREAAADELVKLKKDTGAQLGVLIVSTLDGDNLEESSMAVARKWRLGSEKGDEGILLFVVVNDRKMRIEVGQGLEGVVTDAESSQMLRTMKPFLKNKDYDGAIKAGVGAIATRIRAGKEDIQRPAPVKAGDDKSDLAFWLIGIIGTIIAGMFFAARATAKRDRKQRELEEQAAASLEALREENRAHERKYAAYAATTPSKSKSKSTSKKKDEDRGSRNTTIVAPIVTDYSSHRSSSYDSGSSSSGSSSSGSDWGGGGGDFSGGGSSDSW